MQFRILGPLEVLAGDHAVDVGSRRQRALLAVLLLHPNKVVASDHIIDALWGDDADGKENALWVAVSRLRSALDGVGAADGDRSILVTRDHGYLLELDPADLDAWCFERALQAARSSIGPDPAAASEGLAEALALWRGSPLADMRDEQFAQLEVLRLEDLHLEALELSAEAQIRLDHAREQVPMLEALHREHPFRERFIELLMRSLYQTGRQADALRAFDRYRRNLGEELGLEPSPELRRLEEQVLLHDPTVGRERAHTTAVSAEAGNPFKGLNAFGESDAADFFGRDRLVSDVVRRMADGVRLVALVGASGSGKSSAVRAGVVPAIRKGALEGSEDWLIAQMVPGSYPLAELEAALLRCSLDTPDSLADQLAEPDLGLLRAALRILPADAKLLLVVDQFEELFSLAQEPEREHFLKLLGPALDDSRGRVMVLLTLRADFYDRPLRYPDLARRLAAGIVNVSSLMPDEMEEAAQEPMRHAGVRVEPALLASLLSEVIGQPGALPLFQYTLTMLFDRRVGNDVTLAAYRSMGGLRGALARRAEDLLASLDEDERAIAHQLFLRLVSITPEGDWSRRRVTASELVSLRPDLVSMQRVIQEFGANRLLTFDRDRTSGSPTIEVAHEALLTAWPRLRQWIDEARDDVVRHGSLVAAMNEWRVADADPDYLLSGGRLARYEEWSGRTLLDLTQAELDFLHRSIALRDDADRGRADDEARAAHARKRAKRQIWSAGAVVLVVAALGAAWLLGSSATPTKIAWVRSAGAVGPGILQVQNGWDQAQRDLDFEAIDLIVVSDPVDEFEALLASRIDMAIVDIDLFDLPDLEIIAAKFPDTRFVIATNNGRPPSDLPNITTTKITAADGSFLAGVAAAMTSESGIVGFMGATPGAVDDFRVGYEAGARWAVPDIEVRSTYLKSTEFGSGIFTRPDLGRAAARRLYEAGADVVFHAAGVSGDWIPQLAAELSDRSGRQLWVIGVDADQALTSSDPAASSVVLTSMLKRHDLSTRAAIERFLAGTLGPDLTLGLAAGALGLSTTGGHLSAEVLARIEDAKAQVRDGSLVAPSLADHPPNSLPAADAAMTATWDDNGCALSSPPQLRDGDTLRLEVVNNAAGVRGVQLTNPSENAPGEPQDTLVLIVGAVAGGSNAGVAQLNADADWSVSCRDLETDSVGELTQLAVTRLPPAEALGRITYDGTSCRFTGTTSIPASTRPTVEIVNNSDEDAFVGWGLMPEGTTLADVVRDPSIMWNGIFAGGTEAAPGESKTVGMNIDEPGPYAINCSPADVVGEGGTNFPAAVITLQTSG